MGYLMAEAVKEAPADKAVSKLFGSGEIVVEVRAVLRPTVLEGPVLCILAGVVILYAAGIGFNSELAKKPTECLGYVVVHEMVHDREPDWLEELDLSDNQLTALPPEMKKLIDRGIVELSGNGFEKYLWRFDMAEFRGLLYTMAIRCIPDNFFNIWVPVSRANDLIPKFLFFIQEVLIYFSSRLITCSISGFSLKGNKVVPSSSSPASPRLC